MNYFLSWLRTKMGCFWTSTIQLQSPPKSSDLALNSRVLKITYEPIKFAGHQVCIEDKNGVRIIRIEGIEDGRYYGLVFNVNQARECISALERAVYD